MSLPSREAWIEIDGEELVASLHGGRFPRGKRGLKLNPSMLFVSFPMSLPSREAWIEIANLCGIFGSLWVASLAGSVD